MFDDRASSLDTQQNEDTSSLVETRPAVSRQREEFKETSPQREELYKASHQREESNKTSPLRDRSASPAERRLPFEESSNMSHTRSTRSRSPIDKGYQSPEAPIDFCMVACTERRKAFEDRRDTRFEQRLPTEDRPPILPKLAGMESSRFSERALPGM